MLTIVTTIVMFNVLVALVTEQYGNLVKNDKKKDNILQLGMVIEICQFRRTFSYMIHRFCCCKKKIEVKRLQNTDYSQAYLCYRKTEIQKTMKDLEDEAVEDVKLSLENLIQVRTENKAILFAEEQLSVRLKENEKKIEGLLTRISDKEIFGKFEIETSDMEKYNDEIEEQWETKAVKDKLAKKLSKFSVVKDKLVQAQRKMNEQDTKCLDGLKGKDNNLNKKIEKVKDACQKLINRKSQTLTYSTQYES